MILSPPPVSVFIFYRPFNLFPDVYEEVQNSPCFNLSPNLTLGGVFFIIIMESKYQVNIGSL